jgi:hypothetical protein
VCPNGTMRPDLSALDAQLDALSPSPGFDVLALAESYAGKLGPLPSIDDTLAALEVGVPIVSARAEREPLVAKEEVREQIELPEPLRDALLVEEPTGNHTLDEASTRALEFAADSDAPITARHDVEPLIGGNDFEMRESGAFTVTKSSAPRREDSRDITMDAVDDELLEAEIDEMRPEAAPLANSALFDMSAPANVEAEQEADAAFAALFAEATRQSSMPSVSEREPSDDTEVFHTSELTLDPAALHANVPYPAANEDVEVELEPGFHDETLDSAEFEIVNDVVTDARPANSPSGRPSRPPEKRPSFLGRLFGRKDE